MVYFFFNYCQILYLFYDLELLRSENFSDISRCTLLLSSPSHLVKSTKLFWIMDNLKVGFMP